MPRALEDEAWVAAWYKSGCSPTVMSRDTGLSERSIFARRTVLQGKGYDLDTAPRTNVRWHYPREAHERTFGTILVGGDAHIWPHEIAPAWRAFCEVARELAPDIIVLNGDVIDGARISRHPRAPGWTPSLADELDAVRAHLAMLPNGPRRYWTVGNHDERVDKYLDNHAPELADYAGSLVDRFAEWSFCWQLIVNNSTVIRHRFNAGIHSAYNNAMRSGRTIVTNDTHQLACVPVMDMNGRRYGVETGMLGNPEGPQFQYGEAKPTRHSPGFALLTFDEDGSILPPELAEWQRGAMWFRGRTWGTDKPRYRVPAGRAG